VETPAYVTIQIRRDTRPKLRILAALKGETLMDTIEQIVNESIERIERESRTNSAELVSSQHERKPNHGTV